MRGKCQGCGDAVQLDLSDGTASPCRCTTGRPARGPSKARPGSTKASPKVRRVRASSQPFLPTCQLTAKRLELWLPRGMNSREGPNGRVWQVRHRAAQEWRQLVAEALAAIDRPSWHRIRVEYASYQRKGGVLMDTDNVAALGKPILDALVRGGIVPDDSPEHVAGAAGHAERSPMPWPFVHVRVRRVARRK